MKIKIMLFLLTVLSMAAFFIGLRLYDAGAKACDDTLLNQSLLIAWSGVVGVLLSLAASFTLSNDERTEVL